MRTTKNRDTSMRKESGFFYIERSKLLQFLISPLGGIVFVVGLFHVLLPACDGEELQLTNARVQRSTGSLAFSCDYRRTPGMQLDSVRLYVKRGDKDLYLSSPIENQIRDAIRNNETGKLDFSLPLPYLPAGSYQLMLRSAVHLDPANRVLMSTSGRSLIEVAGYKGRNYELHCKIAHGAIPFIRQQGELSQHPSSWNFYCSYVAEKAMHFVKSRENEWFVLGRASHLEKGNNGWHDLIMRCKDNQIEAEIDGKKLSCRDEKNPFTEGFSGFRSSDQDVAYIDNVSITDADTGKLVFNDDFERDVLGNKWKICGGAWSIGRGIPDIQENVLGTFEMPKEEGSKLAAVELKRRGDGIDLLVNDIPVVPLFFSLAYSNPVYFDSPKNDPYEIMRNAYAAGIRFFAPCVTIRSFDKDGHMDLSILDDFMAQSLAACPEAYFILRMGVPNPPGFPAGELMKTARSQADAAFENGYAHSGYNASLASESYKKYCAMEMKYIITHMQSRKYGKNILGLLVMGGGFEGNWAQPFKFPNFLIDVSQAQVRHVGSKLKNKYGNVAALREAWNDKDASFENPSLPGLEERSDSDIAGFRNPMVGKSRRVLDFVDIYSAESDECLTPIFDSINEIAPNSFFGVFYAGVVNIEHGGFGAGFGNPSSQPLLNHPAAKFLVSILSYYDRRAGGVPASISMAFESFRMHGKIMMEENDLRTPAPITNEFTTEASYEDTIQTMRRQFSNNVLLERNAMWYFDMGYTGPWFNDSRLLKEMSSELKVGNAALGIERRNVSEVLVVLDPNSWSYYPQTTQKLTKGGYPDYNCIIYPKNYCTLAIESMMRMGAPKDFILLNDLPSKNGYKLYMFPMSFHCDQSLRERIRKLAEDGAVCVLMGPAGLIDDQSASLDHMEQLLGMKVAFDGPMPLTAAMIPCTNSLTAGFTGKEIIGGGAYVRCFGPQYTYIPTWYRFYIDGKNPDTEIVAKYADGRAAMAIRHIGKGAIIYSGVPITHPGVYRNIAKSAGVHVYLDTDDALSADGNFIMVHTKEAGKKRLNLREKVSEIREAFSGEIVARNADKFDVELPAKHTAVYYIGKDAAFLKSLDSMKN